MNTPLNGLAGVLQPALDTSGNQWQQLHPDIRARFTLAPDGHCQSFTGMMDVVDRSFMGWLIAKLIALVRILPANRARHVPFEFNLRPADKNNLASGWIKQRLYRFASGIFEFRSVMRIADNGELIEQFPFGLGMKIKLSAEGTDGDTLYFRDDGYFLKMGMGTNNWRMPLPRLLTVGRFVLTHRNIDRDHFTVEITLTHPLLGRLFHQHGVFSEQPAAPVINPTTAMRMKAVRSDRMIPVNLNKPEHA